MIIGILKEQKKFECRVAATPETVKKLIKINQEIWVEKDAGEASLISDKEYLNAGAKIVTRKEVLKSNLILQVQAMAESDIEQLNSSQYIVGMLEPFNLTLKQHILSKKIKAFALESMPRNSRAQSMDVLSSQANIAGYKAVMLAVHSYKKFMPMLMTAAGTVKAAKVMILGAGVAGLQAIATARRLGAIVEASDVRPAVKEQIESLGAKFIDVPFETDEEKDAAKGEGGYAKAMPKSWLNRQANLVAEKAAVADIVITSALIPGREPPILISEDIVKTMKPGAVILDMASGMAKDGSGNCPLTKANEIIEVDDKTIIGTTNLPSLLSADASSLYARDILEFIKLLLNEKNELYVNKEDELVTGCLITGENND
jgi:NAD(P) transhydrogenase subunit alpha